LKVYEWTINVCIANVAENYCSLHMMKREN
jgi:hypothetical protein